MVIEAIFNIVISILDSAGFPLVVGVIPQLTKKLAHPRMSPLLFCPENVQFTIFMHFLAILLKMSAH